MTFRPARPPSRGGRPRRPSLAVLAAPALARRGGHEEEEAKKKPAPIPAVPRPHDPFEVTFPSSDGVRLVATLEALAGRRGRAPPSSSSTPSPASGASWPSSPTSSPPAASRRSPSTCAGTASRCGRAALASGSRRRSRRRPNGFPRDVEAACAWLRPRASRLGVLGFSLSGNLAALATATGWAEAAVAVSPNADRFERLAGTRPLVAAGPPRPRLGEGPRPRGLRAGARRPGARPEVRSSLYPGAAHALALLQGEPAAKAARVRLARRAPRAGRASARPGRDDSGAGDRAPTPAPAPARGPMKTLVLPGGLSFARPPGPPALVRKVAREDSRLRHRDRRAAVARPRPARPRVADAGRRGRRELPVEEGLAVALSLRREGHRHRRPQPRHGAREGLVRGPRGRRRARPATVSSRRSAATRRRSWPASGRRRPGSTASSRSTAAPSTGRSSR